MGHLSYCVLYETEDPEGDISGPRMIGVFPSHRAAKAEALRLEGVCTWRLVVGHAFYEWEGIGVMGTTIRIAYTRWYPDDVVEREAGA